MLRPVVLAVLLALPFSAQAQMASYCGGAVVADVFNTQVTPGSTTRATYSVRLRNTQGAVRRLQIVVTGALTDRPSGAPVSLNPNQAIMVQLGYQTILPGSQALRGEQLANITRISCV